MRASHLGEKVVSENEYLSAMARDIQLFGIVGGSTSVLQRGGSEYRSCPKLELQGNVRRGGHARTMSAFGFLSPRALSCDNDIWAEPSINYENGSEPIRRIIIECACGPSRRSADRPLPNRGGRSGLQLDARHLATPCSRLQLHFGQLPVPDSSHAFQADTSLT
jgi:hypothetical protein